MPMEEGSSCSFYSNATVDSLLLHGCTRLWEYGRHGVADSYGHQTAVCGGYGAVIIAAGGAGGRQRGTSLGGCALAGTV